MMLQAWMVHEIVPLVDIDPLLLLGLLATAATE